MAQPKEEGHEDPIEEPITHESSTVERGEKGRGKGESYALWARTEAQPAVLQPKQVPGGTATTTTVTGETTVEDRGLCEGEWGEPRIRKGVPRWRNQG